GLLTGYWHTSPYSQVLAHHHFRRRKAVLAASRGRPPSAGRHGDEGRNGGSPSAAAQWCYLRYQLLETYPRQRVSVVSLLSAASTRTTLVCACFSKQKIKATHAWFTCLFPHRHNIMKR
ncbi:hypothetical protein CMEL01_09505, partial [Colletotrichum melonis]